MWLVPLSRNQESPGNNRVARILACFLLLIIAVVIPARAFLQNSPPNPLNQQKVVQFLKENVDWYHARAVEQQIATNPGDILFVNEDRPLADQVLRHSFEFARASSPIVNNNPGSVGTSASPNDSRHQALAQAASKLDDQYNKTRAELAGLRQKLDSVPLHRRKAVQSQIEEVQSELAALQLRQVGHTAGSTYTIPRSASGGRNSLPMRKPKQIRNRTGRCPTSFCDQRST